jgi:hypothetical protein
MNSPLIRRYALDLLASEGFGYPPRVDEIARLIADEKATAEEVSEMFDLIEATQTAWANPTDEGE